MRIGLFLLIWCNETSDTTIALATNSPKSITRTVVTQRMIAGFRLNEAPRMGDIGGTDPKHGAPSCSVHMFIVPPRTSHFSGVRYRGITQTFSDTIGRETRDIATTGLAHHISNRLDCISFFPTCQTHQCRKRPSATNPTGNGKKTKYLWILAGFSKNVFHFSEGPNKMNLVSIHPL